MKQAENNEIDTLLRNLARREQAARLDHESASQELTATGAHLDVDELSSYAERALPPSARARCTAHLADCDDCRKIVVQLSLAAGPLTEEHKSEQGAVAGLSWTQRLTALFSPQVMRYAMPALVLVVVAVAFFGWRQQRVNKSSDYVARNERAAPATAVKSGGEQSVSDRPDSGTGRVSETAKTREQKETHPEPSAPASTPAATDTKTQEQRSDEKKPSAGASGSTATPAARKQDAAGGDKVAVAQPSDAPEAASPQPRRTKAAIDDNAANEQQKDLAKNNVDEERSRGRDVSVARKGPARNENDAASQRGPAKRESQAAVKDKSSSTESSGGRFGVADEGAERKVAGRHFRRVNSAWVDTAYKSEMPITTVSRGSEQYRALVADEPEIDSIGKQLSGEVIVVWKGHVYRIN